MLLDPEVLLPEDDLGPAATVEHADGSVDVVFGRDEPAAIADIPHDANLAEYLDDTSLYDIAQTVIDGFEADWESCSEYRDKLAEGIKLLGLKVDDRDWPFPHASGEFDSSMLEALIRFQANAGAEMMPAEGPVRCRIFGDQPPEVTDRANRKQAYLNYRLTEEDPDYYPELDGALWAIGGEGQVFRKVYRDHITGGPCVDTVRAERLVANYDAPSLRKAQRYTHHIPDMPEADVIRMQIMGRYRVVELGMPADPDRSPVTEAEDEALGRSPDRMEGDEPYEILEQYVLMDLPDPAFQHRDGETHEPTTMPLPYIVTVEKGSREVLAIYRNWTEGDPLYKPLQTFVSYGLIPNGSLYSYGYFHILGSLASGATRIQRQILDAGTLANFPGGVRAKATKMEQSDNPIGPCEFKEIDLGGMPSVQAALMALPYRDPSQASLLTRQDLVGQLQRLGSTADMAVGEGRQDAPVGTTIAMIEQTVKIMSSCQKRLTRSHSHELRMYADILGEDTKATYPYLVEGKRGTATAADFANNADVVPVADPNQPTQIQRLTLAQSKWQLAQASGGLMDKTEALKDVLRTIGSSEADITRMMPPPANVQPSDPVTENQNILQGKPVKVGDYQDDDSHIASHMALMHIPQIPAPIQQANMAHIAEHTANKYRKMIGMQMAKAGMQLPPPGTPMPPEIENRIAMATAQATQVITAQLQAQQAAQQPQKPTGPQSDPVEQQLKATQIQADSLDSQRKATAATQQNAADVAKTHIMAVNDAANRQAGLEEARLKLEAAKVTAAPKMLASRVQMHQNAMAGLAAFIHPGTGVKQ